MIRINFYLPKLVIDKLKELSLHTGLSVSEHVRRAIDLYLVSSRDDKWERLSTVDRFWNSVRIGNTVKDCWEWLLYKNPKGYGRFWYRTRGKGSHGLAHRFSWKHHFGKIPDGLFVLHKCDNPSCVNPEHLFLGTNQDNMDDMKRKGRKPIFKGEDHPNSKLSEKDVIEIRKLISSGNYTYRGIAKLFSVSESNIHSIDKGNSWDWLQ